jgi:hypothetical protein
VRDYFLEAKPRDTDLFVVVRVDNSEQNNNPNFGLREQIGFIPGTDRIRLRIPQHPLDPAREMLI